MPAYAIFIRDSTRYSEKSSSRLIPRSFPQLCRATRSRFELPMAGTRCWRSPKSKEPSCLVSEFLRQPRPGPQPRLPRGSRASFQRR